MNQGLELSVRNVVLVSTAALMLTVCWRIFAGGLSTGTIAWAVAATCLLWIPLPWLVRQRRKSYAAFTLCVIPYLIVGLTEAIANPPWRLWAALVLCVGFLLFVSLIAYLRVTRPALAQ